MCSKRSKVSRSCCNGQSNGGDSCGDRCAKSSSRYVRRSSLVNKPLPKCHEPRKKCCRSRKGCCRQCEEDDEDDHPIG